MAVTEKEKYTKTSTATVIMFPPRLVIIPPGLVLPCCFLSWLVHATLLLSCHPFCGLPPLSEHLKTPEPKSGALGVGGGALPLPPLAPAHPPFPTLPVFLLSLEPLKPQQSTETFSRRLGGEGADGGEEARGRRREEKWWVGAAGWHLRRQISRLPAHWWRWHWFPFTL